MEEASCDWIPHAPLYPYEQVKSVQNLRSVV
jgi:hypothetical protein